MYYKKVCHTVSSTHIRTQDNQMIRTPLLDGDIQAEVLTPCGHLRDYCHYCKDWGGYLMSGQYSQPGILNLSAELSSILLVLWLPLSPPQLKCGESSGVKWLPCITQLSAAHWQRLTWVLSFATKCFVITRWKATYNSKLILLLSNRG